MKERMLLAIPLRRSELEVGGATKKKGEDSTYELLILV
jgi:hypothetical protein